MTTTVSWAGWLAAGAPAGDDLWGIFMPLFWLKFISYGVVWYFMHTFSRNAYLFYQNLGYSITHLFIGAFCMDVVLFFSALGLVTIVFTL
ncbi:hypothetical protein [Runella slithyformis]|uniref:hypothetical protein n=1 Tax=Runella slithyformis TaxID=106 RepID=UPI00146EB171|nr:hypothetical protein [Runella slithyformis]